MEDRHQYLPAPIEDEMKEAYVDYAMSVIVSRALPDVRDGLKPVHRRILYTMLEEGIRPEKKHRKSAATVGNVLARYHPHGDASVYDAMVRMAQKFSFRYPLVDPQGNFGSIDGDSAAAMRYTEAKLSRLAMEMVGDLHKKTVDWRPNFDNSTMEPVVLPTAIPNLLINGSDGIAVGMATKIPPHNLTETINGALAMLEQPDISVNELMRYIPGPDFPTGARILGQGGIRKAYNEGRGSIIVRAVMDVEEVRKGKRAIVVTEIPYQVNKARLVERIAQLVKDKRIEGITDLRDESNRLGIRIVFELRNDAIPDIVMNLLYKHTDLQVNYGVIMLALVDGVPRVLSLKQVLTHFLNHRRDVVKRRTQFELDGALARDHIVQALLKALDYIDEIISIIRGSRDTDSARISLMERFEFSEQQAQAILDMTLKRLTGLEREKLDDEHLKLTTSIEYFRGLLADQVKMDGVIRDELIEVRDNSKRFLESKVYPDGDKRRTEIIPYVDGDIDVEDIIPDEPVVVTMSHSGYIRRVPSATFKVQKRGGRGVTGTGLKDEDHLEQFFVSSTHQYLLFFTNNARVFKLRVYELPEGKRTSKGTPVVNLLRLTEDERVTAIIPLASVDQPGCIITATKDGYVKRTALRQYSKVRNNGLKALVLNEGDELVSVVHSPEGADASSDIEVEDVEGMDGDTEVAEEDNELVQEGSEVIDEQADDSEELEQDEEANNGSSIIMFTRLGQALRFSLDSVRMMGRVSRGVRGMKLRGDDCVVSMDVTSAGSEVLLITNRGFGKRMPLKAFSVKGRNGLGVRACTCNEKVGQVVAACVVNDDEEFMISTSQGVVIRTTVACVSVSGRTASGVIVIKPGPDDFVAAFAKVPATANSEDEGEDELEAIVPEGFDSDTCSDAVISSGLEVAGEVDNTEGAAVTGAKPYTSAGSMDYRQSNQLTELVERATLEQEERLQDEQQAEP